MKNPSVFNGKKAMKNGGLVLKIILWIGFLPIMLAIVLYKKGTLSKKTAIIVGVVGSIIWAVVVFGGSQTSKTGNSNEETISRQQTVAEKTTNNSPLPIDIEKITLEAEKNTLILGESISPKIVVAPENADAKGISWSSSDDSVAMVDSKGTITAVSGGTAVITATSGNGVEASTEIYVDGSKGLMRFRFSHPRDDDNNIGDDWSFLYEINGERPSSPITVSVGEELCCWARFSEDDKNPDVGEASKTYVVKEEDLINGFTITMDVYVKENGGQNSGKAAHFIATFSFSPYGE